ncbi:uncharacterized protein DDB_G0284459-like isoform X1 [Actinia tenebrosa]|uniref:Uncharacterized protein DDB_G0284459-like isoform X1 n=1 Tax=Actinia tenebrosa TaxID=6105 RepID=A0A6P8ICQ2_ACTTE|nr:uncharacterized protein DDB_G0284459-like isoform X1 [Actinia tenebrosa]
MPSSKLNAQEVDAYSDSGSTISLASCGSGGSGLTPKPPLDATSRSRSVKGRRSKVTQPPSPYASRQVTAKRHEAVNSTTRNLWLTSMKNGTGALSTNNTAMNTWAGPRPSYAKKRRPGSRTRNFSDVVEFSKTKSHSRSASLSNTEPHVFGGGPALKPAEDYYDEIIGLKKIINSLKEDNNLLSTKLHRVEEENIIKDRKMYDLLNSRKQPEDLRRTLTDKRGDTSAIVNSLKQKLHGVERTVKEKEAELSNLRRELKMTDIEELRIQSETYYQEVQRLQLAMLQMQQERINYTSSMTDLNISDELASARGKRPMSASQHRLLKDIEMLKAENKSLKKELISAVENQSKKSSRQSLNVDYADMSRAQLLHAIHELEMKLDEPRDRMKDSAREKDEKDEKKGSKKRKSQESEGKLGSLEETQAEMTEERDKLRQMIERLKEDRTHYRNVADDLRKQLKAKEEEVEDLHHRLSQTTPGTTDAGGPTTVSTVSGTVMRRKSSTTSTASQSSGRRKPVSARERDLQMEKEFEEFKQRHAAKVLQKQWRSYQGKKQDQLTKEQEKLQQEEAAKTLQREWKKHLKLKERASQDEVITDIQAAFRGHLARKDRLDRFHSDSMDSDDAIINVQSAMRGHLTRSRNREEPEDEWPGYKAPERINHEASDNADDDEDDIVIRRSSSYNKSPFSSKKRSKFTAYSASPSLSLPQPTPRTKSPPHPAPRTLKTPDSTPPSPAPRHKGRTAEVRPPESVSDNSVDSDDDNVVIGGSSLARKAQSQSMASSQTKQINKQNTRPEDKPETKEEPVESSSCIQSKMDQSREQVLSETDSDSDNELVVFGKAAARKETKESRKDKRDKYHLKLPEQQEEKDKSGLSNEITESALTNEKPSIALPNKIAESSLTNEKSSITLSNEMAEKSLTNGKPSITLSNEMAESSSTNDKPLIPSTNDNMSKTSGALARKNTPTLSLANRNQPNAPGLIRNKFFSGIGFSKTDKNTSKQKIPESKLLDNNNSNKENINETTKKKSDDNLEGVSLNDTMSHDQTTSPDHTTSLDSRLSNGHMIAHDIDVRHDHSSSHDLTLSNVQGELTDEETVRKEKPEKATQKKVKQREDDKHRKPDKTVQENGLTKDINPQRTIAEVSEESDNQLVASSHKSPKKTNSFKTSKSSKSSDGKREKNIHEIIDSDDDDDYNADADDGLIVSHAKGRSSSTNYGKSSAGQTGTRDSWSKKKTQTSGKMRKTSSRDLDDSEEESDDNAVVVTSKKRTESKQKDIVSSRSSFQSRASSPKRASLVDSLLSPKRTLRTSEDIRTTGRGSINDDDDDDDDDDDIVVGSWRKRTTKEQTSPKKDSLSSLWSDSSKQKKKSSSGLGFGSFEKFSSSRKRNSGLDELF